MHRYVMVALVAMLWIAAPASAHNRVGLDDLEVERKAKPVGIDVERPRFSWVIESDARDVEQKAYRVRLTSGHRTVWDSGLQRSDASHDIEYTGPKLTAATRYEWRVDVLTNRGSASEESSFRTGLYTDADWAQSKWIGNERPSAPPSFDGAQWIWTPEATTPVAPAEPRAFRKTLTSTKTAVSAEIAITADDLYRLSVNGRELGSTTGAENEWQQARRFFTSLEPTRNVIAIRTNNGPNSPAGLLATIKVTYADGSTETFTTDTTWKAAKTFPDDFANPAFDDSAWGNAVTQAAYGSGPWGRNVRTPRDAARPAPLLRRDFTVNGRIRNATLFYAAGGYADFSVNGKPASQDVLSPGFTDYDDTVQYATADLTKALKQGTNNLGAQLGRGFYGMTGGNVWRWESPPWHDEPVVKARLRIEYENGKTQDVITDKNWQIADGPTVFDDLYAGETYDARVAATSPTWRPATEAPGPKGVLVNQRQQPIRVTESLPATEITTPAPGVYVVKFPRVLAGWVEYTVTGPAGTTIRAQHGEKLLANGRPDFSNNGGFQSGFQTDRFILAGTGKPERWAPRFSYKGFQYIEVTGWPGATPPPLSAFTAKAVHSDVPTTGQFTSSSELMNRTHKAVVDTMLNNLHGIPTDTPMFEKNGWTGDAAVGAEMFTLNFDVHELFAKWMRDVHETREPNGRPLVIAPSSGNWGVWGIAPPWHSAYVFIPEWLNQYGGDKRPLTELYDGMRKYVDLEFDTSTGGIVNNARLGDWVSPEASPAGGNAPEDLRVSATAYLYAMLRSLERSAQQLNKPADVAHFAARAETVKAAFNARFLDATAGFYRGSGDRGYRQTHNVLAVAFGLAPTDQVQRVVDSIAADVRAKGDTLNTGVLGTKYLLPVLTEHGHADLALTLATQTNYPSWGYMIENGATSMWEHWALEARSRGHYFLGTVDDWFFHHVGGITASQTTGYRDVTIAPAVTGDLEWARVSTQTPYGPVKSDWRTRGRALELRVDVPVGSTATVKVPAANVYAVTESGDPVSAIKREGTVDVTVGSGRYTFVADERQALVGTAIEAIDAALTTATGRDRRALQDARDDAFKALKELRSGDITDAAERLADALRELEDVRGELTTVRDALGVAISDALDVRATATLEPATTTPTGDATAAPVRPGDELTATVTVANGPRATVGDVRAKLTGLDTWTPRPAEARIASQLRPRATGTGRFSLTVPADQRPGTVKGTARVSYVFDRATVTVAAPIEVEVVSAIEIASVTAAPTPVRPGGTLTVTTTLRNAGRTPATGALQVDVPAGWTAPAAQTVTIPATGDLTVTTTVAVPRNADQSTTTVTLTSTFGGDLATGSTTARVELAPLPTTPYDRIDLGNSASEQAHGLTAAPSSGTSPEAGLTRRYAGHLTPFSWFEFDATVVPNQPFVLRVIETYDRAQTKRYKVYVDGKEAFLRTFSKGGGGTETYEYVVPATLATSAKVRIKFENQDDPAFYDPSIADVWTYSAQ
ncbi:family 78 glycoside hydrolase catalytic domain [Solirubrobacter phytolaccae]|uniref:alpha-L-rhamnosidase n=1 Tax=Solirubrobacter phytolaccae TaxID=1404360 RepID=A0A9X3NF34_9ACTN|nr:family 78 glycoside hydrolase catalytic domain [Solirubrobacter phytolaccae]MDA0183817.1 family 78 glycoside hydrolase catalytic domain [Solirubrobacter phytolaccae]